MIVHYERLLRILEIFSTIDSKSLFISHSHTVMTVHPDDSSSSVFLLSRSTFLSNFCCQKSALFFGTGRLHLGHLCQKQPLTKIATLLPGYAMSGLPVAFFQLRRYPGKPDSRRDCLRIFSGPVFLLRFAFIILTVASFNGVGILVLVWNRATK